METINTFQQMSAGIFIFQSGIIGLFSMLSFYWVRPIKVNDFRLSESFLSLLNLPRYKYFQYFSLYLAIICGIIPYCSIPGIVYGWRFFLNQKYAYLCDWRF